MPRPRLRLPRLRLAEMVDGLQLRAQLTALTVQTQGDATSPAVRAEALALFKRTAAQARERAEAMLVEDGTVKTLLVEDNPGEAVKSTADSLLDAMA